MDKIILTDDKSLRNYYYYNLYDMDFAYCSSADQRGKARLLTQFAGCRETVAGDLFARFSKEYNDRRESFGHLIQKIDLAKTQLAMRIIIGVDPYDRQYNTGRHRKAVNLLNNLDKDFENHIIAATNILNIIEENYSWEKTQIKEAVIEDQYNHSVVKPPDANSRMKVAYVIGDKRWMRAPHILSLYLLLLRLPFRAKRMVPKLKRVKSFNGLLDLFKVITGGYEDGRYLRLAAPHIPLIFERFDELFAKKMDINYRKRDYVYKGRDSQWRTPVDEGISTLCRGKSVNVRIAKAFATLSKDPKAVMRAAATMDGEDLDDFE